MVDADIDSLKLSEISINSNNKSQAKTKSAADKHLLQFKVKFIAIFRLFSNQVLNDFTFLENHFSKQRQIGFDLHWVFG